MRARLAEHMRLARLFAEWIDARRRLRAARAGPVQRRVLPCAAERGGPADAEIDAFNERLLESVNATGEMFISHTRLDGRYALRLAIGNLRTTEVHVARAWELLREHAANLRLNG